MYVEANLLARIDAEALLQHFADPQYAVRLRGVGQPHSELVALGTDVYHSTVYLKKITVQLGMGRIKIRDEDPDPLIFGPPDPDPTCDNGFIKSFSF